MRIKEKALSMAILSIVLISAMFSVGYAGIEWPKFKEHIKGESTDEAGGTTTLHMKIEASADFAGQEVEIEWDPPPPGGPVQKKTVTLDANGDYEGDLEFSGFNGVGKDGLVLKSKIGQVYDRDPGEWVYAESKKRVPIAVGGIVVSVNNLGLLAPYIGLASTLVVATVATAIYVKRVKRRKEKQ